MIPRTSAGAPLIMLLAWAVVGAGCATAKVVTEHRPDGIYHLTCNQKLQVCLDQAEVLCDRQRYVVLRAFDLDNYAGPSDRPTQLRTSEAFVRCGYPMAWGVENTALLKAPVTSSICDPAPREPVRAGCTPGMSVACIGAAGCNGGQVCAPDGAAFGPCDCGPKL